jgi:hypothetical protein
MAMTMASAVASPRADNRTPSVGNLQDQLLKRMPVGEGAAGISLHNRSCAPSSSLLAACVLRRRSGGAAACPNADHQIGSTA